MKEIGECLRGLRVNHGVSVEEAASDLNVSKDDISNLEDGITRAFKDIFILRDLVNEYAKYLGADTDKVNDEFNDFMFEKTSKISLDDIKQIRKEELYSFVNENDPAIIYFSVSDDEDCRTFEEEISSLIQDYSLEDIVVYMNLRGEDVARYLDTVAAYYHYDGSFEEVPTFLYFEDGEIKEVLTDTLKKEDVKTFFQTIGVIS